MQGERWRQVDKIFHDLIEQTPEQRASFLDRVCEDDPSLKKEVEDLVQAYERSGSFLDSPAAVPAPGSWIGRTLGSYEFKALLGSGGMGDVYRARDPRLRRDVAIKVLPDGFSRDADRISRFQREAEVLASLNHPHIAAIFDIEKFGESRFLVLELVEGETLADRFSRGPVPIDEALLIARQIAEALEAAHEKRIVHRDLKPANVKIRPDGNVKVLDFGLAKVRDAEGVGADPSDSPTMMTATTPGIILGTAAYMSPEQAKGKDADLTTDVWAFGCVLYEMLTGRRAFEGETAGEILAGVFKTEPDWNRLPAETPEGIRRLLRRCLQKDQGLRLRDLRDVRIEIADIGSAPPIVHHAVPSRSRPWERLAWVSALTIAVVAAVVWVWKPAPSAPELRFEINAPPTIDPASIAISPNGQKIVFAASADGRSDLALRSLDSPSVGLLAGTDGARFPFWSPDSRSVGFFANGKLKRIDIERGSMQDLADVPAPRGGAWNRDGIILFARQNGPIFRVLDSGGGDPVAVTRQEGRSPSHRFPQFLPDGRHFLFFAIGDPESRGVYVGDLGTSEQRRLFNADTGAVYASSGQLLFPQNQALLTQSFDAVRLQLTGKPVTLAEQVTVDESLGAALSVSAAGPIVYRSGPASTPRPRLTWFDRSGNPRRILDDVDSTRSLNPALSFDGRLLAMSRYVKGNTDIGLFDLERRSFSRFTFASVIDTSPIWSPDGSRIVYASARAKTDLYEKRTGGAGSEDLLLPAGESTNPTDWAPDGRHLLYSSSNPNNGTDIWALPLHGDRKQFAVVRSESSFQAVGAQFSPDGKWIAYQSNETSRFEIYIQPFPGPGPRRGPISSSGGVQVRWRRDGKELFYIAPDNRLMAVSVKLDANGQAIEAGVPVGLFTVPPMPGATNQSQYVVLHDGQFLVNGVVEEPTSSPIKIILNWKPKP